MVNQFDVSKIELVDINKVKPNTWNPKELNTKEYLDVVESIRENGQQQLIIVRENNGYEILDGEQRYRAMLELGHTEIYVYNMGTVSDEKAKAITLWFQVQVPFNRVKEAELVIELGDFKLPYTEEQKLEFSELLKFDWENFNKDLDADVSSKEKKEFVCPECGHTFNL